MPDEGLSEKPPDLAELFRNKYLENAAARDLKPYVALINEGMERCLTLVAEAMDAREEIASEILRAAVVLSHAYLEDFIRNLALARLPLADEKTLNAIPLVGSFGRVEKFQLGRLAEHRGKRVDAVIYESVGAYLERSNFNGMTEIICFRAAHSRV